METKRNGKEPIVSVQLPHDMRDALKRLARAEGRTVSSYLRIVIGQHIARRSKRVA